MLYVPPKCQDLSELQGIITQKIIHFKFSAVRSSEPAMVFLAEFWKGFRRYVCNNLQSSGFQHVDHVT
jgi:hypothetical protein